MKKLSLALSAAAISLCGAYVPAHAEVVHTKTYMNTVDQSDVHEIYFSKFDINNDGLYAKSEVGERLFYAFDLDGNQVIDNIEWDKKTVLTVTPMEKEVYKFVDYNDDGYADLQGYSYELFFKESGLIMFDENKDGLSAAEFISTGFQSLDDNDNNTIELSEWQEAYEQQFAPLSAEPERYND
jgi:hypothetical protein|tara:strand:+ start:369 stop:917 length:549 start_codon:yes stop_codon:yes gene_type:complete